MFYFTTSVQMKHFQCVIHKPECSIQTQVVILKVLMIKSSAVTEPRERDKNCTRSSIHLSKSSVNTLLFRNFHYVHLTTCVRLEEIINHQHLHLLLSPIQLYCPLYHFIPIVLFTDKICCLRLILSYLFWMIAKRLQLFSQIIHICLLKNHCLVFHHLSTLRDIGN